MRADGYEHRIEAAGLLLVDHVLDLVVEDDAHTHLFDPPDLAVENIARQAIGRDAEVHHAAGKRPGLVDLDLMTHQPQMMRARQPARPAADNQDPLARRLGGERRCPAFLERQITQEPLDGVDAHRAVELAAIAVILARMIADPPVHRRHRVVSDQGFPGFAEAAGLGVRQPRLDVLAGRTGIVTRRQQVEVDRPLAAYRSGAALEGEIGWLGQVGWLGHLSFLSSLFSPVARGRTVFPRTAIPGADACGAAGHSSPGGWVRSRAHRGSGLRPSHRRAMN